MRSIIDSVGNLVLPEQLREHLTLRPGQVVDIDVRDGRLEVVVVPATTAEAADPSTAAAVAGLGIPASTLRVIADSRFRVEPEPFVYVHARAIGHPELHHMVLRDELETTVVTTEEHVGDVEVLARNPDRWVQLTVDCAHPFYCVGFLAAVTAILAARGIDVLLASAFTRDLVLVKEEHAAAARRALLELGFQDHAG